MAKPFLIAVFALGFLSGCGTADENDFALSLYLKSEENSEDSHSQMETLDIHGTKVTYTSVYEGYSSDGDFDLSLEQVESLKLFLKEQGLDQNLEEKRSMTELGTAVELKVDLEIAGEKTSIQLEGMSAIYGDGTGESNLENVATASAAQDLISIVKDLGGLYED
ncbi:MAG: hypothetical protein AAB383_03690 [Patescibacteria group bacterium]